MATAGQKDNSKVDDSLVPGSEKELHTFNQNTLAAPTTDGSDANEKQSIDYSRVRAKHVADICIKAKGNDKCVITASTMLPPDRLVLADYGNDQLNVIDTKTDTMISEYQLDAIPVSVCKASDSSVAVIVHYARHAKILFFSLDDTGTVSKTNEIRLNAYGLSVVVMNSKILVSYRHPPKIEIMDPSGTVLRTINDSDFLHSPYYIAVSPDRQFLYVSNRDVNSVECVSLGGALPLVAEYEDSELHKPTQISFDSNGMVYVGCLFSHNVHLFTRDLKKVKVILDESDGLEQMRAVCFCDRTSRLYIAVADVIKIFHLSYK